MRERNEAKALMYHHFAAQGGSFQSKMALAYTYYRQGMYEKAAKLYAEIAKTGVKSFLTSKDSPVVEPIMIHDGAAEDKEVLMNFLGEEDESFKMLMKEAEEGNAGAMYRIGMIHLFGLRGLRVDHAKALSWLSKAADKGEPESMYLLGEMYASGVVCVERNYTKALELLTLASQQHLYAAYDRMGYLYLNGYGVDKDYTKVTIEYFEKAAENGGAGGHYNLGLMYLKGTGVKRNAQLACKYFLTAANSGYDLAYYQLAKRFHTGVGLKKNLPVAAELYKLIADYGPGDVGKAFLLYSRMAELGYEVAQSNAAWILDKYGERSMCMGESGLCTDAERHQRAHSLWQQASKQGNEYAASRIGDA
ncbi:hypothetical protein Ddye_003113 [Dipteronia dyeriana]|uniref:Uncharacterized protein n=1 Tax=Dipteronia dyeriana TaxID=168575 RepID=A0AAE0CV64_9ROSI|nr:hypothetical protein Ddye_003113 [Dipteronia dyeriana]